MTVPLLLIVVVSILAIFFTNSNQTMIEVIVFGSTVKSTIGFVVIGALSIGIVLGILSMLPSVWKRSFTLLKQGEELAQMKQKEATKRPETKL
jgi:MFS superfamily sulfate permease-like transporter